MPKRKRASAGTERDQQLRETVLKVLRNKKLSFPEVARRWVKIHGGDQKKIYDNLRGRLGGRCRIDDEYCVLLAKALEVDPIDLGVAPTPADASPAPTGTTVPTATAEPPAPSPPRKPSKKRLAISLTINGEKIESTLAPRGDGFGDEVGTQLIESNGQLLLQVVLPPALLLKLMQN